MTDFAEQLIMTLKKKKIAPVPRWIFVVRNAIVWALGMFMLILSAIAIATIFYLIRTNDWDIYEELASSLASFVVTTIPYAWLFILAIFISCVYLLFVHTPHGYRYRLVAVTGSGLVVSSLLGSIMYAAGVGERIDEYVRTNAPRYHTLLSPHSRTWEQPARGRIAGNVLEHNEKNFKIQDEEGTVWTIENSPGMDVHFDTSPGKPMPERVRILGSMSTSSTFKARMVLADTNGKILKNIPSALNKKESRIPTKISPKKQNDAVKKIPTTTSSPTKKFPNIDPKQIHVPEILVSSSNKKKRHFFLPEKIQEIFRKK